MCRKQRGKTGPTGGAINKTISVTSSEGTGQQTLEEDLLDIHRPYTGPPTPTGSSRNQSPRSVEYTDIFINNSKIKKLIAVLIVLGFVAMILITTFTSFGTTIEFFILATIFTGLRETRYVRSAYVKHDIWSKQEANSEKCCCRDVWFILRLAHSVLIIALGIMLPFISTKLIDIESINLQGDVITWIKKGLIWAADNKASIDTGINVPKVVDFLFGEPEADKTQPVFSQAQPIPSPFKSDKNNFHFISQYTDATDASQKTLDINCWIAWTTTDFEDALWAKKQDKIEEIVRERIRRSSENSQLSEEQRFVSDRLLSDSFDLTCMEKHSQQTT